MTRERAFTDEELQINLLFCKKLSESHELFQSS